MTLLPIREAARRLSLTPQAVRNLIKTGRLEATKIGRAFVVSEEALGKIKPPRPSGRPKKSPPPD